MNYVVHGSCWCVCSIFKYCYVSHWFCFIFVQFDLVHGFQIAATYLTHREAQIQTIPQHVCMLGLVRAFYWKKKELMEDNPSNQETEQNGDNLPKKNPQHATAIVFVYVAYNLKGKIFHCMCIHLYCLTVEQLNAFAKAETHASTNSYSIIILHIVGFQQDARHSLSLCRYHSHPPSFYVYITEFLS